MSQLETLVNRLNRQLAEINALVRFKYAPRNNYAAVDEFDVDVDGNRTSTGDRNVACGTRTEVTDKVQERYEELFDTRLGEVEALRDRLTKIKAKARLKYLRGEIEAERISYGEIAELQSLVEHIDDGDVLLLEWAGVPEFPPDTAPCLGCGITQVAVEILDNGGVPVNRYRIKLPESCEVNIDEENGEIIIDN